MKKGFNNINIIIIILLSIIIIPTQANASENVLLTKASEPINIYLNNKIEYKEINSNEDIYNKNVKQIKTNIKIADSQNENTIGGSAISSGEINTGSYKPEITNNSKANSIISQIFGALQVVGGIAIVISIAMIGLNNILGTVNEKSQTQGKAIGILFGAIMIGGISTIAKLILSVVE